MSDRKLPEWFPVAAVAVVTIAVVGFLVVFVPDSGSGGGTQQGGGTTGEGGAGETGEGGLPKIPDEVSLTALEVVPQPAIVVNVYDGPKVRAALAGNAWTKEVLAAPLGRGFLGGWAGFFGTRGEDLDANFTGTVQDLVADQVLGRPFQLVWFSGRTARSTPALVVQAPDGALETAFGTFDRVAQRGTFDAGACPDASAVDEEKGDAEGGAAEGGEGEEEREEEKKEEAKKEKAAPSGPSINVSRWVIAGQSVYAGSTDERMAFGRVPGAVQLALCATLPKMARTEGVDVEIAFETAALGRESQGLTAILGIDGSPRAAFAVDGNKLIARGLAAAKADPRKLDTQPLSNDLLKIVPADMPVVLTFQVKLPAELSAESLKSHLGEQGGGGTIVTRQIAVVWNPHGDKDLETEVALVWSAVQDEKFLGKAFSGSNELARKEICDHLVLSSSKGLIERLEKTCAGKNPSMLNAAPEVLAGFRSPASVGVNVDVGGLLSRLTLDAWNGEDEEGAKPGAKHSSPPPELLQAAKQLEALPVVALRGVVKDGALVPGGKS